MLIIDYSFFSYDRIPKHAILCSINHILVYHFLELHLSLLAVLTQHFESIGKYQLVRTYGAMMTMEEVIQGAGLGKSVLGSTVQAGTLICTK